MGVLDTQILGLSLLAQFMLDRKWIENWWVWLVVNPLTVVFAFRIDAGATALLSVLLTVNVAWGLLAWKREYNGYTDAERWQDENKGALNSYNDYVEENGLPLAEHRPFQA
jgi:nicotinamide mononucleotide transporter